MPVDLITWSSSSADPPLPVSVEVFDIGFPAYRVGLDVIDDHLIFFGVADDMFVIIALPHRESVRTLDGVYTPGGK